MPKTGRPTKYTEELAAQICEYVAQGTPLREIAAMSGMPAMSSIFLWLGKEVFFSEQYARAKEELAEVQASEIISIADNEEDVQRAKVRIDARKWVASKLKPKQYGDKVQQEVSGPDGGPVQLQVTRKIVDANGGD